MDRNNLFYNNLPIHNIGLTQLLSNPNHFKKVPKDWHIVVVDVESSTQAVKHKLHHPVNYAASLSIIVVLNEVSKIDSSIEIPFFFGGDGASFLIPESIVQRIEMVLENVKELVLKDYFLSLRVGSVQIRKLNSHTNSSINISRIQLTEHTDFPIAYGNGLKVGEDFIKSQFSDDNIKPRADMFIDTNGCNCRWSKVLPPKKNQKVLCFIASPLKLDELNILHSISKMLDATFGNYLERLPITVEGLEALDEVHDIHKEYNDYSENSFLDTVSISLGSISQMAYNTSGSAKTFLKILAESSVAILIDGSYCDIVTGDDEQIKEFINFLNDLEKDRKIIFGYHITDSAVLSCYVAQKNKSFVHLMDANEGGFSTAAKMLKIKAKVN
mgnify:CR=1 FL=1|tara:strand:- start:24859 stop:26013 length:1155 start_codon:yes stop_codon:yes gene_type:complete